MAGLSLPAHAFDARWRGVAVTILVHLGFILAWHMARALPPLQVDGGDEAIVWLREPAPVVRQSLPAALPAPAARRTPVTAAVSTPPVTDDAPTAPAEEQAAPAAGAMVENALRSVGDIDRALRKERQPTIVAPPDSPQIRMRDKMELARSLAPPRLWEAPKVEELVNNTGDGARRTRVITGNGTYCITERAPTTSIDMIEKHGKQRFTNCPEHEEPAKRQVWRTARD